MSILVGLVPEAAVAPILIFVGLEITAQAFVATPAASRAGGGPRVRADDRGARARSSSAASSAAWGSRRARSTGEAARTVEALRLLGNGFILSALLWAAAAAMIIDRRLLAAAAFLARGEPRQPLAG